MSTTSVTTHHPARDDVSYGRFAAPAARPSRRWALAGVGAGLAGIGTVVTSSMIGAVYDPAAEGDVAKIADKLETMTPQMFAFHSITVLGAVLTVVFAAGLHQRLRATVGHTSLPVLAFGGLLGTAVVSTLASGLDTEFMMTLATGDDGVVADSAATMYNHWVGTIPWVWVLSGISLVTLFAAARLGGAPRWIGRVGLVLGALAIVVGISPLQYLAAVPGVLGVLVVALGFTFGDKQFRG